MNTLERLKAYFESQGIAVGTAEKACGFGNATLRNAFDGGKGVGSDKLEKILSVYPNLSSEWLLRGTGSMIVGEGINQEQILKSIDLPANSREIIEVWIKFMSITEGMQDLYKQTIKIKEG
jgi:hypothetical protein